MKKTRKNVFETNSSSTHALVMGKVTTDYLPFSDNLKIEFMYTDNETVLTTLQEKVSYLVSHIASWYKYEVRDYEELIEYIKGNYEFKELEEYVLKTFNKKIVFPKEYKGEIEDIVDINHQLISWNKSLEDVMRDMLDNRVNLFDEVLANGKYIEFGRD